MSITYFACVECVPGGFWVVVFHSALGLAIFFPYIYRLLFGNSDHLHGDVFHTVPGKKRKHKKKTQNQYSSGWICCVHSNTITIKVSPRLHSYYYNINIYTEHGMT